VRGGPKWLSDLSASGRDGIRAIRANAHERVRDRAFVHDRYASKFSATLYNTYMIKEEVYK
jgi:hypothetical protein